MFKLNKTLIKRGFKSLFKTKLFSSLMMILILITGSTYTMLSQASNSFGSSYNQLATQGNLHDYVIKSGFKFTTSQINSSKLDFGPTTSAGALYDLTDPKNQTVDQIKSIAKEDKSVPLHSRVFFEMKPHNPTGVYSNVDQSITNIYWDGDHTINDITASNVRNIVSSLVNKAKNQEKDILYNLESKLSSNVIGKLYNQKLNGKSYSDYLYLRDTNSLFVQDDNKSFNMVDHDVNPVADPSGKTTVAPKYANDLSKIDNLVMYDGTSSYTQPLTDAQFRSQLEWEGADFSTWTIDKSKDFRQTARPPANDPTAKAITFTDPLAYQAVVSPGYANANNKKSISMSDLINLFEQDPYIGDKIATDKALQAKYKDNLITVGNTPYFIIGVGTQPDYAYPIMNARQPVVDEKTQAVVFVANRGYDRIQDSFRSNPTENYIALKFKPGVTKANKDAILKGIDTDLRGGNNFPVSVYASSNIDLVTTATQSGDQVLLTEERVSTLKKLQHAVGSLSFATTTLLILFLLSIIIMILKALISGSRKIYATLHALGYSKIKIALSNALTAFVLMALPMLIAYGVGYGFQFLFINQFSNSWTIPTYGTSFSWSTLLVVMMIPTLILFFIIVTITLYELRFTIPRMLSGAADLSLPGLSRLASKAKLFSIKSKYVMALSFGNIGKLALMATSALIAMSALMVGVGTIGRADFAYNQTTQMNNYQYAVDFVTPTKEGGQYTIIKPYHNDSIHPTTGITTMPTLPSLDPNTPSPVPSKTNVVWQIPKANDINLTDPTKAINNLDGSANYLNNVIQNKATLDLGTLSNGSLSVWDIAERLMPDNQKNQANENFNVIMHHIFDNYLGANNVEGKSTAQLISAYVSKYGGTDLDVKKNIIKKYFDHNLIMSNDHTDDGKKLFPYTITYNHILADKDDESYTYLDGFSNSINQNVNIKGLKDDKMVNISDNTLSNLKLTTNNKGEMVVPVLINKYLEKSWNAHTGSTLDYSIDNSSLRTSNPTKKEVKIQLKVAGIINGYNDSGIYTSQKIANSVLGLDPNFGFNGIFSTQTNPKILSTLSLYSTSGLYFPTDSFKESDWKSVLQAYLNKYPNQFSTTDATDFINNYGATPFTGLTSNVRWNKIDQFTFRNVTTITSTIIAIVEAISITLSILFTIIVAALLFKTNSKKIAALWAIGYRRKEVNRMFLSMYIVPLIIAIGIATPIAIATFAALQSFIMSFGHILIPLAITWWVPIVALAVISLIFIVSTTITIYTRGSKATLEAFKGE